MWHLIHEEEKGNKALFCPYYVPDSIAQPETPGILALVQAEGHHGEDGGQMKQPNIQYLSNLPAARAGTDYSEILSRTHCNEQN